MILAREVKTFVIELVADFETRVEDLGTRSEEGYTIERLKYYYLYY